MQVTGVEVDRTQQLAQMISEAESEPGLREVIAVFDDWRRVEQHADVVRQAMEPAPIIHTAGSLVTFVATQQ